MVELSHGNNCWRDALAQVAQCAPPSDQFGQLSADGTLCTYSADTSVAFRQPVGQSDDEPQWDFELTANDELCVDVKITDEPGNDTREIATASGPVVYENDGERISLSCPDGSVYSADLLDVIGCDDATRHLPGSVAGYGASYAQYALRGGPDENTHVLLCE